MLRALFAVALASMPAWAHAQACKVLDPELLRSYSGPCVNGFAEGEGVAAGVAEYRGGFQGGHKHGYGVKTWPNGDRYEGQFSADQKEGYGVYEWGQGPWQGERYDGTFAADHRHGYGIYWWPSGDVYEGPWNQDQPTGAGTEMMRARAKFAEEAMAAVAREGQKVCRQAGPKDWVRGVVTGIEGDQVGVRIDDPGAGAHVTRGAVIWDVARSWTPCW